MKFFNDLKSRGIIKDITNPEKLSKLKKGAGIYIGFDPTADSLHLGNYIQIITLLRFKEAGFNPIALLGGATGMIGDPSGKSEERNLQTEKDLLKNKEAIKKQLESFGLKVFDNFDIYKDMNVLTFLREAGKLLNVNYMINKDVVKSRLETGISFTEFSYQLIQGWDFKELYMNNGVRIQCGGSDQWGNITSGVEIIRKTVGEDNEAVGITTNLLLDSNGKKFGKSSGGALWLDKNLCSPYKLYQYLINIADQDVEKMLLWATLLSEAKIKSIMKTHNIEPFKRFAQTELAKEIISNVHTSKDFETSVNISQALFGKQSVAELKTNEVKQLIDAITTFNSKETKVVELLVAAEICKSNREAREFIKNKAIQINGETIESEEQKIQNAFDGKYILVRKGKKNWFLIKR